MLLRIISAVTVLLRMLFLQKSKNRFHYQFGEQPLSSSNYGKIINEKHFHRISGLIDHDKVIFGGHNDRRYICSIAPTVMDHVTYEDKVMQEEIFGPIHARSHL